MSLGKTMRELLAKVSEAFFAFMEVAGGVGQRSFVGRYKDKKSRRGGAPELTSYFYRMDYTTLKALHLIFMVTWFAGLFYIVRLFIYHREALEKQDPERHILTSQFHIMERRLWYAIAWPSAVLCTAFGVAMLVAEPILLKFGYMHLKLAFVAALLVYQVLTHGVFLKFQRQTGRLMTSIQLRFFNEFPTVVLIAVVFIIVRKDRLSWVGGLLGILGVAVLLTLAIKWYQRLRRRSH